MLVKGGATSLRRLIFAWIYFRDCKFWYSTRSYILIDLFHLFIYLTVAKYVSFAFGDRLQILPPRLTRPVETGKGRGAGGNCSPPSLPDFC